MPSIVSIQMSTARTSKVPWARLFARAVASVAMLSFAYASVACVANGALGLEDHHAQTSPVASSDSHQNHHDDAPQGSHHGDSGSEQSGHDHGGAANCCSSMTSIVPSAQQTTANSSQLSWVVTFVWALTADSALVVPQGNLTCEHGPPDVPGPDFLSATSLSPRAPPLSV